MGALTRFSSVPEIMITRDYSAARDRYHSPMISRKSEIGANRVSNPARLSQRWDTRATATSVHAFALQSGNETRFSFSLSGLVPDLYVSRWTLAAGGACIYSRAVTPLPLRQQHTGPPPCFRATPRRASFSPVSSHPLFLSLRLLPAICRLLLGKV